MVTAIRGLLVIKPLALHPLYPLFDMVLVGLKPVTEHLSPYSYLRVVTWHSG